MVVHKKFLQELFPWKYAAYAVRRNDDATGFNARYPVVYIEFGRTKIAKP